MPSQSSRTSTSWHRWNSLKCSSYTEVSETFESNQRTELFPTIRQQTVPIVTIWHGTFVSILENKKENVFKTVIDNAFFMFCDIFYVCVQVHGEIGAQNETVLDICTSLPHTNDMRSKTEKSLKCGPRGRSAKPLLRASNLPPRRPTISFSARNLTYLTRESTCHIHWCIENMWHTFIVLYVSISLCFYRYHIYMLYIKKCINIYIKNMKESLTVWHSRWWHQLHHLRLRTPYINNSHQASPTTIGGEQTYN